MLSRICAAFLYAAALLADPVLAQPSTFSDRLADIMSTGGPADSVRDKLTRLSREATSPDQQLAIEAYQLIIRGLERDRKLELAEAERFAAEHPASGAVLLAIGYAALNANQLDRASDAYVLAIARTPWLADAIRDNELDDLVGRLVSRSDGGRLLLLARALFGAGWTQGSPSTRSYLASTLILDDLRTGRAIQASDRLPDVTEPQLLYGLMADNRYAAIRPEIERLWGPRLEKRWREYLDAHRSKWMESGTGDAASDYASALQQANRHQVVVDQFLPRFMRGYNCWQDPVARRLAGYLVTSLTKLGREAKAQDVLRRLSGFSAGAWSGPSLGSVLLSKGDFDRAARVFELSIQEAKKLRRDIRPEVLVLTNARLACANHQAKKPMQMPATESLALSSQLWVALCVEDMEAARSLLLAALESDDQRLAAIQWLQPFADPPKQGAFATDMAGRVRALQSDPRVLRALALHGSVHDWSLESSAPPESSMRGLPVRRASPCSALEGDPMDAVKPPESLVEGRL